ncbi:hypothetical protein [Vibrio mangrovi]|uniref:Flagellar protein FlaG n=1 Tax=Vibrio mangrovi TaxID=474394 RepID=A0A1Y6IP77_9VIBR|nr:hypothetical protein [Vibrio mangrovi]MDW6003750.1 hypothetical protein [Vibrio mangrovi]SMR99456.1 hypothetical protein VIM7927_00681 [Vibrio mangrovi]
MNIQNLEQLVGMNLSDSRYRSKSQHSDTSPELSEPKLDVDMSLLSQIDPEDHTVQKMTVEYVNNLMKFQNIGLQAELHHDGGQAYIALTDAETGNPVKKMKVADVIQMLAGRRNVVNVSV